MSKISQIEINGTSYDIYDASATDTQYQIIRDYEGAENAPVLKLEPINGINTYASEEIPPDDVTISGATFRYFKTSDGYYYYPALAEQARGIAEGRTIPISKGGTDATTAAGALQNLGLTATATELNRCVGVTSNIQTQINTLLERIAELEAALANKQDKIYSWGDLANVADTNLVNVAEEGA